MKFDVIVGNPPYQEEIEGTSAAQIYPYFMDLSYSIADVTCLITPARFLMNAGKTSKSWNEKMLNSPHLKIIQYYQHSSDVFPGLNFSGGVVITLYDKFSKVDPIKFFYPYEELTTILRKVKSVQNSSLQKIFYPQIKWNLETLYSQFPEAKNIIGSGGVEKRLTSSIFTDLEQLPIFFEDPAEVEAPVLIYGKKGSKKYISKLFLEPNNNIEGYKAIISAADGASGNIGEKAARITGKPFIGGKNTGYNQTFIGFGNFSTERQADCLVKYLKTRFVRPLVGTKKATNGIKKAVWSNVPLENFNDDSDIDWSRSIADIEQQLYTKYGLSSAEIEFIENKIEEMN